jgi:hypothetical protein
MGGTQYRSSAKAPGRHSNNLPQAIGSRRLPHKLLSQSALKEKLAERLWTVKRDIWLIARTLPDFHAFNEVFQGVNQAGIALGRRKEALRPDVRTSGIQSACTPI